MNSNRKTPIFSTAFGAIACALSVIFLYASSMLPVMKTSLPAVAGIFCAFTLANCGVFPSILVYFATTLLSLLLLPTKTPAVLYAILFGIYPILKHLIERLRHFIVEWLLKLTVFNLAFGAFYYAAGRLTGLQEVLPDVSVFLLFFAANMVFIVYDILISMLVSQLSARFYKK